MFRRILWLSLASSLLWSCQQQEKDAHRFSTILENAPQIDGKSEYLDSPYFTPGNRVYMVGHQNGSFPELGWHIQGEMGGIWNHPIKLMDGFDIKLLWSDHAIRLDQAEKFTNYPVANKHSYQLQKEGLSIDRWQFVPDNTEGIFVQLVISNTSESTQEFDVEFLGHVDLRPTWLAERQNIEDGKDAADFNTDLDAWIAKDENNPWFTVFGSSLKSKEAYANKPMFNGKGLSNSISYRVKLEAGKTQTIDFVIAGSYASEANAIETYKNIQNNAFNLLKAKRDRYQELANQTKLTIPDKKLQETFEWLKYNSDWLVRTVPEIGTGIAAGIPDYPWWFGVDSEYALKGYMAIGQTETVDKTIRLLDSISEATNGNGRIVHEVSTNGVVFNPGNINETPQFASLIWEIYQWNGDKAFLETYYPTIKKGLTWLMTEKDQDQNLFPDGFGMMEIHGLDSEMIDVAAYTQRAFVDASKIAAELNDQKNSENYKNMAAQMKTKINEEFWSEEFASYADFIGTDKQALHLIDDAIIRADTLNKPWAVAELKATKKAILKNPSNKPRPFVLHHNWVVNTPMEMKIAPADKAKLALKTAEKFVNPFGVFVTGIDRDDSAGSDDGSFKGSKIFSYTGAVMTLPTGVQVVAENNYGNPNQALNYLKRMTRTFSYALPGSMYEVSPDYGMIAQAWNIYSFAVPIVQQYFGVLPQAQNQKIVIAPQMPDEWNEASLENIKVAENTISINYKKNTGTISLEVDQTLDWEIEIQFPKNYSLESKEFKAKEIDNKTVVTSKNSKIVLQAKEN
jgi:glycogen debranching enzyme